MPLPNSPEECTNLSIPLLPAPPASPASEIQSVTAKLRSIVRRQTILTPGYVTTDDWGSDGDHTPHSLIPSYDMPNYIQGNGSFPTSGAPDVVDIVFLEYFTKSIIRVLNKLAGSTVYGLGDVGDYLPRNYTTKNYLQDYAKAYWQEGMPNCPVGKGVGFDD
jgi:hypothetical protein